MDCCNCLPYRAQYYHSPHQQYYHHQHDPLPPYPQQPDYGFHPHRQMYRHDYYGGPTAPYYDPQHWAQPTGFGLPQEYVYNPKEARIRKAMREANRDRPMGPGVMLPRPSARRADWVLPRAPMTVQGPQRDDHLVMSPMNVSANPNCFPNEYAKMQEAHMQRPMSAAPAGYYQPNPLTQLQEHTDMWHNYHDDLRARNVTGMPGYMVPEMPYHHPQMASHHHHQPSPPLSIPSPLLENGQTPLQALNGLTPPHSVPVTPPFHHPGANVPITPPLSNVSMTPPHSNENVPPDLESQPIALTQAEETHKGAEFVEEHQKQQSLGSTMQPLTLTDNNIQQSEEEYLRAYNQGSVPHFEEKADDTKVKKQSRSTSSKSASLNKRPPSSSLGGGATSAERCRPLPDFNEAFGGTQRGGRFQSQPPTNLTELFYNVDDTTEFQL
nr:unnamed protein product [Callosobruchus chinensis]